MDIILDYETYSEVSLQNAGATKYCQHPSTRPLCLAYKPFNPLNLDEEYPTKLWVPGFDEPFPDFSGYEYKWAFNTYFDYNVMRCKNQDTNLNEWKDVEVVLSKYSLPQNLHDAAEVTGAKIQKHPDGNLIINRCCKKNSNPPTEDDMQKLYMYCIQDVDATLEVLRACPRIDISDYEWRLWRITCIMNQNGLPIDYKAVQAIKNRCDSYKQVILEMLPEITDGKITTPNQHAKIKQFLHEHGVKVPNTTADTLEKLMEKPEDLPDNCRMLIEIRQAAGASSVAKFDKLLEMRNNDKVHDFLRYGHTNTQRWGGAGFQVHSLPKKTVDDPDELIRKFIDNEELDESPIQAAKALCRPVILAPTGQLLYQADYSSIEYLLLIWITDMYDMLELYEKGKSAYIDMAAYLFEKPYESIDKHATDNLEYFLGKQVILGCGYQMGAIKFRDTCLRYGQEITPDMAKFAVTKYREKYAPIADLWNKVHKASVAAIMNPGQKYEVYKCIFQVQKDPRGNVWLIITLPSNTKLFYHSPEIASGAYGPEVKHMGLHNYKWVRRFLSPGRITENIIQKLARDLMAYGLTKVVETEFTPLMTVHDELVSLGPEDNADKRLKRYLKLMELTPAWAESIPLKAGGYYGKRYKKD
jgi:DNA polymerase